MKRKASSARRADVRLSRSSRERASGVGGRRGASRNGIAISSCPSLRRLASTPFMMVACRPNVSLCDERRSAYGSSPKHDANETGCSREVSNIVPGNVELQRPPRKSAPKKHKLKHLEATFVGTWTHLNFRLPLIEEVLVITLASWRQKRLGHSEIAIPAVRQDDLLDMRLTPRPYSFLHYREAVLYGSLSIQAPKKASEQY